MAWATPGRLLVTWETIGATTELASALDVSIGDAVMHLERVLLATISIGLESTYLPSARFGGLKTTFDPVTSLSRRSRRRRQFSSGHRTHRDRAGLTARSRAARIDDGNADAAAQPAVHWTPKGCRSR